MTSFTTPLDMGLLGDQDVAVQYRHHKGYPATWFEPGEPEHCELIRVDFLGQCIMDKLCDDALEALKDAAMSDWAGEVHQAQEARADRMHDDRMAA